MSSDPRHIRILSVDDHPLIRQGIAGLVAAQADMNVIAEAANGREAIEQFRLHRPDITLMDLQMPQMSGLDAIIAISGDTVKGQVRNILSKLGAKDRTQAAMIAFRRGIIEF